MTTAPNNVFDAIVIGGGPAGLSAALVLVRACRRVVVVDAGEPRNAAARQLNNFLGRENDSPHTLHLASRQQVAAYGVTLIDDVVEAIRRAESGADATSTDFVARTRTGVELRGRKVLFATGVTDELPAWPGVRECYGATVHHCPYCDAWEHRGQHLVACGRDATKAVGLGLMLRTWSARVSVLTDGESLSYEQREKLEHNGISFRVERVRSLRHQQGRLAAVLFNSGQELPATALFFNTDQFPQSQLPRSLGIADTSSTDVKQRTAVAGVFIAGDADGDVQFAIVAAAEGATAATAINRELQEEDQRAPYSLARV